MRKSTSINLELIKGEDGGVKFYAKQFDDLKLNIKVYDGLEEVNVDGQDIIVCIIKEDKTVIEQTKDITVEDNTIVARLSKQATTALGKCSMEVLLRDEEGTASTTTISYLVSEKLSASIVEMIKSEDDINALNLIEEFIETSNVDMLDIKEAIKDLKATVDGAQDSIDAEYETILEALRALEGTIIENIEGKANEALTIADEAVEKVTEALNNADEVLVKVEEAKGAVGEITTEKDNALQAIESIKARAINDIDETRTDSLEAIRDNGNGVVNDLNSLSDTLKADIANAGLLETNKIVRAREEALTMIDDLKDNAMGSLSEEALKVEEILNATVTEIKEQAETDLRASSRAITEESRENIGTIKDSAINEINGVKDDLGAYKDEVIEEAVKGKEEAIKELNDASNALNNLKATILNDINTNKEEAISNIGTNKDGAINELNEVKAGALVDINNLKNEVDTLLNSLNEKVVESNGNIQELAGLIEEAREVAGLVRAFIDSKAVDLSNYYTKEETNTLIDEKIGLIEFPETDLTNYYTKVEVDKKFENKGIVGISKLPVCFTFAPEAGEEVKHIIWAKDRDGYCYVIHITVPNSKYHEMYLGSSLSQLKFYGKEYVSYRWNGEEWVVVNLSAPTISMPYQERGITTSAILELIRNEHLFYCTLPVKEDGYNTYYFKEPIEKPNVDICGDYNEVVVKGIYRISHSEEIPNCPESVIEEGILDVKTVKDDINNIITVYQEVKTTNEKVYSRVRTNNNNWSEWIEGGGASDIDLSSYSTTEEVRELINESVGVVRASLIGDINDIIGGI